MEKLMKKTLLAITTLSAFAIQAHAQSSVTLYGIADGGFSYTSNAAGGRQFAITSGNSYSSRWGIKGTEDLGSGLKAIFTLEGGFSLTSGTIGNNGTLFGRQAWVGLGSDNYGSVMLGRQNSDGYLSVGQLEAGGQWAASGAGYGAHPADIDNLDNFNRANNAIKYQSPNFNGLTVTTLYSLGGKAGNFTQNEIFDLAATYQIGSVVLGGFYTYVKDPNFSFYGNKANDSTTGLNISSPVQSGYASAGSQQIAAAGGAYTFGPATVGLVYSNTQFHDLGTVAVAGLNGIEKTYTGGATFNTGEVNFKYQVSPALQLGTAYIYMRNSGASGASGATYQQVDVGGYYSLSKRTSLYVVAVFQKASGTDSTGHQAVAAILGATPSNSNHQTVATVGITQKF
jgi:predicted porin